MQALATENHHLHNQLADTRQALTELGVYTDMPDMHTEPFEWLLNVWFSCIPFLELTVQKLEARLAQQVASQATNAATFSGKRRYGKMQLT